MTNNIDISPGWVELSDKLNKYKGIVMVIGASDTGKSTLVSFLGRELYSKGNKVCIIDGDVGQSIIGPPTTIGLAFIKSPVKVLHSIQPDLMFFVGSTSPLGRLLPTIVGMKKLLEKSIQNGTDITIINTTGFVSGEAAWELKFEKINLINPGHIIAIQRSGEIENILEPYEGIRQLKIHRLAVHEKVKRKSQEQRRLYREQRFREYFRHAEEREIRLDRITIVNPYHISTLTENIFERDENSDKNNLTAQETIENNLQCRTDLPQARRKDTLQGLLVGLNDEDNFTIGLGKVEKIDLQRKTISLLTPLSSFAKVKTVRIGSTRLDLRK
jgi:polynucleotide 5'-hydroxyl-kinase GRC3/NOL9